MIIYKKYKTFKDESYFYYKQIVFFKKLMKISFFLVKFLYIN